MNKLNKTIIAAALALASAAAFAATDARPTLHETDDTAAVVSVKQSADKTFAVTLHHDKHDYVVNMQRAPVAATVPVHQVWKTLPGRDDGGSVLIGIVAVE
jgi:hypothetical protein